MMKQLLKKVNWAKAFVWYLYCVHVLVFANAFNRRHGSIYSH